MSELESSKKWKYTLITVIIAVIVFHPETYKLVDNLLSNILGKIAINGCPTLIGFVVHMIVFTLLLRYIMDVDFIK